LTLHQANAPTLAPFSKEDKILIKILYEYKCYSARQFITEFPDKGWTKNCINRLLVKLRNGAMLTAVILSLPVMQFRTNIKYVKLH